MRRAPGAQGLCADRRLRRRDRRCGSRATRASTFPRRLVGAAALVERDPLRREPAPAGRASTAPARPRPGVATARQLQGKELSYNNYADTDAAFELVAEFAEPAVAIIKHANPCGAAIGAEPARGLGQGAGLRPGQRLRRHRRGQPAARRRDRRGDRRRSSSRSSSRPEADPAAREILARKSGAAAAGDRRPARPEAPRAGLAHELVGRAPGPGARPGHGDPRRC